MKIVHVVDHYQEKLCYQEHYLAKAMTEMGHDVSIIASDKNFNFPGYETTVKPTIGDVYIGTGEFITNYGAKLFRLKSSNKRLTGSLWLFGLKRKLQQLQPDIVYCHGIFSYYSIATLFYISKLKCPVIFDEHTTINIIRKDKAAAVVYLLFRGLFSKVYVKRSRKIIGISDTTIDVLRDYYGITGSKVEMIPLGTDTTVYYPDAISRATYRAHLQVGEHTIVVMYTGKMYDEKNVHLIIDALNDAEVFGDRDICINLVGSIAEEYKSVLTKSINNSRHRVVVSTMLQPTELACAYNGADICVWPDHTTTSTVDAAACGKPVVCSHYMSERVINGNGVLVRGGNISDLKAALRQLVQDDELRLQMGRNGKELVDRELSWNKIASRFLQV
jgi:glycosyltransferase involved in cell wall biosynthesis